ncbi:MAG: ABC transporter permease [Solirubrobacteraceae bacterium]
MAVAGATTAAPPATARPRGRVAGAIAGLLVLAAAIGIYTQIGTLGLGLAPSVALLLVAVPAFVVTGAAIRRAARTETADHTGYPFQLAYPSLAFYCAFFIIPLAFLVLFAVATPLGFGGVQYGFDLGNFEAGLDPLYVEVFLRTLRTAAIGTLLIVLVGYPLAYWIARYAPERRRGLLLALIIVPFWTSFLIRTYSFLIVLSPEFFLSDWLQSLQLTDAPLALLNTTAAIQIGLVYNYLPLFVLPLYATLERMDWRLVEAATDLGASQWAAFRQITLRLTAPGLVTGTLLVFIPMMGEYVIPLVLGGGRVDLIGNVIQRLFLEAQDYALGSALALLVMGALSFFVALYLYLSTRTEQEYGA